MRFAKIILPLAALATVPAIGQGLGRHNSKAPVDFTADRFEVQDRADRVVVSGNVVVNQAGLTLNTSRLTVAYSSQGGVDIDRIDASGGVVVRNASTTARGDFATYDLNRGLITMVGGVQLDQGANRLRGGRLVLDLNTDRAVIDGSAAGAPGVSNSGGRVSGRFTVKQK